MEIGVLHLSLWAFCALASSDAKRQVFLQVTPNRSHFFQYDRVSLSCEVSVGGGRLRRNTTSRGIESCPYGWGTLNSSICIINTVYPSDTGLYWCESSSGEQSQAVHIIVTATLRVLPNRSQFFQYEPVSLSCGQQQGNSSEWRIKRNTSSKVNQECSSFWDGINDSSCSTDDLYPSDTGVYWCESAAGGCSDGVSIMVTAGSVILEGPVSPVMEGDNVTLRCRTRRTSSSNPTTDFYKDGLLLRRSSTGNLTILSVSKSDEGIYKCNISGAGESLDSQLTVRVSDPVVPNAPAPPLMTVPRLICHIVVGAPYLLTTIIAGFIYRDRRAPRPVAEDRGYNVVIEVE